MVVLTRRALLGLAAAGVGFGGGLLIGRPSLTGTANEPPPLALAPIAIDTSTAEPSTATPVPTSPTVIPPTVEAIPTAPARPTPTVSPVVILPTRTPVVASALPKPEISHVKTDRKVVALTFDAGADKGETAQTLRVLRERGVRATFFVTGRFAELFPALVADMTADGHEIANHTYDHKDLVDLTNEQIAAQLEKTDAVLRGFTGGSTKPLMRAPFGSRDARVRAAIDAAGYRSIYWALDGGDWKPGATPGGVINVLKKAAAGDVIVQHCSTAPTASALPTVLNDLAKRGLAVVTVSALLS